MENEEVMDEKYPFISEQTASMLDGSADFQRAYSIMRIYDASYEHYKNNYDEVDLAGGKEQQSHAFATYITNRVFGNVS